MSADIVSLPRRTRGGGTREGFPLVLVAKHSASLLQLAEQDLASRNPRSRKAAATLIATAAKNLEQAVADHCSQQAYSLGQTFLLAMTRDGGDVTFSALKGAEKTLRLIADAISTEAPT